MSIASELTRLAGNIGTMQADVNATLDAISAKGVTVPAGTQLHDVPGLVDQIGTGQNFIYLSYFKNFDTANDTDYPIFGRPQDISGTNKVFTKTTETIPMSFVGQVPALSVYCSTNDVMSNGIAIHSSGDYTMEWFAKFSRGSIYGADPQVFMWFGSRNAFHITPQRELEFLFDDTYTYELFNRASTRQSSWNMNWFICPNLDASSYHHIKVVCKANGDYMCFVDDVLYVVTHGTFMADTKLRIDPRTDAIINVSQLAIYSRSWPYASWT